MSLIPCIIIVGIILLYLWMISPNLTRKKRVLKINRTMFAHRGFHTGSKRVPENSLLAFDRAILHRYGIELDVHLTKDKKLIVFHDDTLNRMCERKGQVEKMTYAELRTCALLGSNERIPLLSEVLKKVNGRVPLLIELKLPYKDMSLCPLLYEELKDYQGFYLIQSFNTLGLFWFRRHAPHILRGQLSSNLIRDDKNTSYVLRFLVQFLLVNFIGRPDFISYKHRDTKNPSFLLNRYLFRVPTAVWTLRTKKALEKYKPFHNMYIFERTNENY